MIYAILKIILLSRIINPPLIDILPIAHTLLYIKPYIPYKIIGIPTINRALKYNPINTNTIVDNSINIPIILSILLGLPNCKGYRSTMVDYLY